jgi:hypothetical protein
MRWVSRSFDDLFVVRGLAMVGVVLVIKGLIVRLAWLR